MVPVVLLKVVPVVPVVAVEAVDLHCRSLRFFLSLFLQSFYISHAGSYLNFSTIHARHTWWSVNDKTV